MFSITVPNIERNFLLVFDVLIDRIVLRYIFCNEQLIKINGAVFFERDRKQENISSTAF